MYFLIVLNVTYTTPLGLSRAKYMLELGVVTDSFILVFRRLADTKFMFDASNGHTEMPCPFRTRSGFPTS